ncbi:MAG: sugar phosphate nucleotidyltransferase [Candidatus Bathyarchaeia archaeon]
MSHARRAVIPAAGLGTRLLPATKEQPKEMLPVFVKSEGGRLFLKPLLQVIFEQLFKTGVREFCVITGRTKRAIEDHFTPDNGFLEALKRKNKFDIVEDLERFYAMLRKSTILWVNQPEPTGFGDAVLLAHSFAKSEDFLVHAGDSYIISEENQHIKRLIEVHERKNAAATILVFEAEDPRQYGVIEGKLTEKNVIEVSRLIEKPEKPPSNLAIAPVYVFKPVIFEALAKTPIGKGGEKQLTDAIQILVDWNFEVFAVLLRPGEKYLDIGNPETYWTALQERL